MIDERDPDDQTDGVVTFEALYDPETLAALDAWTPCARGPVGPAPAREPTSSGGRGWRGLTAGVALNAMVLGVGDALGDGPVNEAVVELRPATVPDDQRAVTVHFVPGSPRRTRVIVRPWLLAG